MRREFKERRHRDTGRSLKKALRGFLAAFAAGVIVVASCGAAASETVLGDLNARYERMPTVEHAGTVYRLRSRITSVLLAGIDKSSDDISGEYDHRSGGQADFLMLAVIDDAQKTIQPIHISRDTMTEITILGVMGDITGTRVAQICLAHSFGDGGAQSCGLLKDAVSGLLLGTPIDEYYVMTLDGISAFNDVLGGVEVELTEDFTALDPDMTKGSTLLLTGSQAEIFVRHRYSIGDQTDVSRRERQRVYIMAAADKLMQKISDDAGFFTELNNALEGYVQTGMSRGMIINLGSAAAEYEILPAVELEGENVISGDGYMEFYPDEELLTQLVINAFYQPIE